MYTKIHLQLDKSSNKAEKYKRMFHNHFNYWICSLSLCEGKALRRGSSLFRYRFVIVRVVRLGILEVSLYLSSTARYFRPIKVWPCVSRYQDTILIIFDRFFNYTKNKHSFYFRDHWLELLANSNTFKGNCSTRIVERYIYSYTVSFSVKQMYKSKVCTVR